MPPDADVKTPAATDTPPAAPPDAAATAAVEAPKSDASPLASADTGKREGAPDVKQEIKPESKPEATPEAKAEGEKPPAESKVKAPPETKPEAPEPKAEPPKPDAKLEESKTDKETPDTKPEPPPTYEALKVPDGFKLDETRVKKVDELFGKTELATKADHAVMSQLRQDLTSFYVEEVQRIGNEVAQHQRDVWNRLIEQRVNDLKSDPQLGGNRIETTLGNAKYALESLLPEVTKGLPAPFTKADAGELIAIMDAGGVSHHKLMIKALNGLFELLREPEPVPGNLPLSAVTSREPGKRGWYDQVDAKAAS